MTLLIFTFWIQITISFPHKTVVRYTNKIFIYLWFGDKKPAYIFKKNVTQMSCFCWPYSLKKCTNPLISCHCPISFISTSAFVFYYLSWVELFSIFGKTNYWTENLGFLHLTKLVFIFSNFKELCYYLMCNFIARPM